MWHTWGDVKVTRHLPSNRKSAEWTHLAQNALSWAFMNTVTNLWVPRKTGREDYWPSERLLLLPLALQPTVGVGLSNNVLPFFPICHQLSPSPHSQYLKISFYFLFPSFPGSFPSSRPFQFLSEDLFGHPILLLSRWPNQLIFCPFIHFTIFSRLLISSNSRFVRLFHFPFSYFKN